MRVLVTGAGGFIGRRLIGALRGHADVVRGDLRDAAACREALQDINAVVHLAGLKGTCEADPLAAVEVNVAATAALLAAAQQAGVQRFLFASSYLVYGRRRRDELPCLEGDELRPCTVYGMTKALAERFVRASPLTWTIVRLGHVYGADLEGRSDDVTTSFLAGALRGETIQVHGAGRTLIDPIAVEDVAEVLARLLVAPDAARCVLNVASGAPTTVGELAKTVRDVVGRDIVIRDGGPEDPAAFDAAVNVERLHALLPEFAPRPLREGLQSLMELVNR